MPQPVRPEATICAYGDLRTDRDAYAPLDRVTATVTGRARGDTRCFLRVEDAKLSPYFESEVILEGNRGTVSFPAAGALGVHWVYLRFPDQEHDSPAAASAPPGGTAEHTELPACPHYYAPNFGRPDDARGSGRHIRYTNFVLDADTVVRSGDESFDSLYDTTRRRLSLNRRVLDLPDGPLAYYCSADSWCTSVAWLRDWVYHFPAIRYWERDLPGSVERFLRRQHENGVIPDNVGFDGTSRTQPVESDAGYVAVMAVWGTWRMEGDDDWMAARLPALAEGLDYVRRDPLRWDEDHQLVTRAHTCDTWDFEIGGLDEFVGERRVIATCDQTGFCLALRMMAEMHDALNERVVAQEYLARAEAHKQRANTLLWDGVKYLHHVHCTPMEHPGFDESQQLAASNTWSMTRGMADSEQAASIIDEYRRRHPQTGDAFPWWSLQPGYPDELGYWPGLPHCVQGAYANGGLLPYVGGELCRASFAHGREHYGLDLLRQYTEHLRTTGNRVHVWYWTDGQPGMRTANEVPRTGWGMAEWLAGLLEGLAGVVDTAAAMRRVTLSPRWAVTDRREVFVSVRYAANDSYFAYRMTIRPDAHTISVECAGSGDSTEFHVLLPEGWRPCRVRVGGTPAAFTCATVSRSQYVDLAVPTACCGEILIECRGAGQST